jgi:hypothetical protein
MPLVRPRLRLQAIAWLAALLAFLPPAFADPTLTGQNGLIAMPDGRIAEDGTWRTGYSYAKPYSSIWSSWVLFPWLEVSGVYTRTAGVTGGFSQAPLGVDYGSFKDKRADLKVRLLDEGELLPSFAIGAQDPGGTRVYPAEYAALSKKLGEFDFTVGYGAERIDGVFGGVRYSPRWLEGFSVVAEYDAYKYAQDFGAIKSGVSQRDKGVAAGLEYRWNWFGLQVSRAHDEVGVNAYVSIPLQQAEFIPKIDEPEPDVKIVPRPTLEQWRKDQAMRKRMADALYEQDFRNIRIQGSGSTVKVELTNVRISLVSRAVGRAARAILLTSPIETQEIEIVYTINDLPFVVYTFSDVHKLQRYFNGMLGRRELATTVSVRYASPADGAVEGDVASMFDAFDEPRHFSFFRRSGQGFLVAAEEGPGLEHLRVGPRLDLYFNDPSGALRYNLGIQANYSRMLAEKLFVVGGLNLSVLEDVSDVTTPSNSLLPHVRTDIADYAREHGLKIDRLLLNRYFQVATGVYARASAGLYEEMFGGAGGQVLYLPRSGKWAADLAVDAVRQRDTQGYFGFRDYSVVTAIASLHYKVPVLEDVTATARAGRFLARDDGVRFELKRRFRSGFEFGAWYTFTDGKDTTNPGTPDKPYHDKGIYILFSFNALMTQDTQATATLALQPWTRDVGQMVVSPGDLYQIFERGVDNVTDQDGLVRFGDLNDDYAKGKSR